MGMVLDTDDSNNDDSNINPIQDGPDDDIRGGPPTHTKESAPPPPLALSHGYGLRLSLRHCFACCH